MCFDVVLAGFPCWHVCTEACKSLPPIDLYKSATDKSITPILAYNSCIALMVPSERCQSHSSHCPVFASVFLCMCFSCFCILMPRYNIWQSSTIHRTLVTYINLVSASTLAETAKVSLTASFFYRSILSYYIFSGR